MNTAGMLREEDGRLTGGVSPSHDDHFFTTAHLRLNECCCVIDARAFELRTVSKRQFSVLRSRRDDNRPRPYNRAIINFNYVRLAITLQRLCAFRDHQLSAKFLRLCISTCRKFLTRDTCWKPQVVLDL